MRIVIISGLSGSGKSVALDMLEDKGFYCIDNIPVRLFSILCKGNYVRQDTYDNVGVGLDARNVPDIQKLPDVIEKLSEDGVSCEVIFLQAKNDVLLSRYSETRRKHPLISQDTSLKEAISKERVLLSPIIEKADLVIDTSNTSTRELRELISSRIRSHNEEDLSILIQSFGYKDGLPPDADFVFDVRCLQNPYWEPELRNLNGHEQPVKDFLSMQPRAQNMIKDIADFLERWMPYYRDLESTYLTVAIGCTGGQHRSVYIAEAVAKKLSEKIKIQIRHHGLS